MGGGGSAQDCTHSQMYWSTQATVTVYYGLNGLNNRINFLIVLEVEIPK